MDIRDELERIAALRTGASQPSGGVTFFNPTARRSSPGPSSPFATAAPPSTQLPSLSQMAEQARQGPQFEREEEDKDDEGSKWGRALGLVVNNPVSKAALFPLDMWQNVSRGGVSTFKELNDLTQGNLGRLAGFRPGTLEEPDEASFSQWWEQLRDPEFGFGTIAKDIDTGNENFDKWFNRSVGFIGDAAFDPLAYASGGVGVAGRAGRASSLNKLAAAQKAAVNAGDSAAMKALGGTDELERLGRRGLNVANQAQREAMGLRRPGMYLGGQQSTARIPGTGIIERGLSEAGAVARVGAKSIPGAAAVRRARGPVGYLGNDLNPAYEKILTGEGGGTIEQALEAIELDNAARLAGRNFEVPASDVVDRLAKRLEGLNENQVRNLRTQAEAGGKKNILTRTAEQMVRAAARVGVDLPQIEGATYAMPHTLTREFRDHIEDPNKVSRATEDFRRASGIIDEDLLEDSGFVQRRHFRPGPDGEPGVFKIGDREITIQTGSVDELNEQFAKAFPGFRGKIYEEDPAVAWRNYVAGMSREVAKRRSMSDAADAGVTGFFREGEVPATYNPYVTTPTKSTRKVDGEEVPIDLFTRNPEAQPADTQFYRMVPDPKASKAQAKQIKKTQGKLIKDYQLASEAKRVEIANDIEATVADILGTLRRERDNARGLVTMFRNQVSDILAANGDLATSRAAAQTQIDKLTADIKSLGTARGNITRSARNRTKRQQDAILKQVQDAEVAARAELEMWDNIIARSVDENKKVAEGFTQRAAARRRKGLVNDVANANNKFQMKQAEIRANWIKKRRKDPPTDAKIAADEQWLKDNADSLRVYNELEEQQNRLRRRAFVEIGDDTSGEIGEARRGIAFEKRRTDLDAAAQGRVDRLESRITQLLFEKAQVERQASQVGNQLSSGDMKKISDILDRRDAVRSLNDQIERGSVAERMRLGYAQRQLDDFETQMRTRTGPEFEAAEAPVAQVEVAKQSQRDAAAQTQRAQQRRLGQIAAGRDPETNQVIMDEAQEAIRRTNDISDEQARLRMARQEKIETQEELLDTGQNLTGAYDQAMNDLRGARSTHEDLSARLRNTPVVRAKPRQEMTVPGTVLDEVIAGNQNSFMAQPLHRTVRDVQSLIDANPQMSDDLLSRTESALHASEQALADVTEGLDINARQAQQILKAAKDGSLSDVMMPMLKDDYRRVWANGDVLIAREIEAMYHNLVVVARQPKMFGRLLTTYTNFFKTYATLSPGFHLRNGMSAVFMNSSDGVPMATQATGMRLWNQYAKSADPIAWLDAQPQNIQDAFAATFASGAGGRFFEAGVAEAMPGAKRATERIFSNKFTKGSQRIGQDWVEGPVRLSLALDSVNKGMTTSEALNRVTRIHFDYSQVSEFDEKAKRFIPFWTFMSRNLPLQVSQMWMKPKTYTRYASFVKNFSVDPAEFTPEYILEAGGFDTGVRTPDLPGMDANMPLFLQPDFPHLRLSEDIEKIENVLSGENPSQMLSDFNPFFTAPIEFATNTNLFYGSDYRPTQWRAASGPVDMLQFPVLWAMGEGEFRDGNFAVRKKGTDFLRSINPLLDRTSRLFPESVGGEGGNRRTESVGRFIGLPFRTVSPEQMENEKRSQKFDADDKAAEERALERALSGG